MFRFRHMIINILKVRRLVKGWKALYWNDAERLWHVGCVAVGLCCVKQLTVYCLLSIHIEGFKTGLSTLCEGRSLKKKKLAGCMRTKECRCGLQLETKTHKTIISIKFKDFDDVADHVFETPALKMTPPRPCTRCLTIIYN